MPLRISPSAKINTNNHRDKSVADKLTEVMQETIHSFNEREREEISGSLAWTIEFVEDSMLK